MTAVSERSALDEFRRHASLMSGGISTAALYRRVRDEIERRGLSGSVMDFGAGVGNFTGVLAEQRRFDHVAAADLIERPAGLDSRVQWIAGDLNSLVALPAASFDLVVSIETIEHLENPRAVMREWHRLLKPRGVLIFTTPNNDNVRSILTVLVKGHFQQFTDPSYPAHITALLVKDIERIAKETGFVDLELGYEVPVHFYRGVTWKHVAPFISRVGKRTSMHVIAICKKG